MKKPDSRTDYSNKKHIGSIDKIYVSETESEDVGYFIDHYLSSRNYAISNKNRDIISKMMELYPQTVPIQRDELHIYLDRTFKKLKP